MLLQTKRLYSVKAKGFKSLEDIKFCVACERTGYHKYYNQCYVISMDSFDAHTLNIFCERIINKSPPAIIQYSYYLGMHII